ncbi:MAG: maleylacetoacetate isomerase [Maricaulaceae bacterium]
MSGLVLHGYWRSGTSYRVRLALALKGLDYVHAGVDLRGGEQSAVRYRALSPQGLVPSLETPHGVLVQSPAILEWLDEVYADPPLLPTDPFARAQVRAMAMVIGCDIHPLNNLRVLKALRARGQDQDAVNAWAAQWCADGFAALESLIERYDAGGPFAAGEAPGFVECYLLPQLYSARRFDVALAPYARLLAIEAACDTVDAMAAAHPDRQPDADPA